MIRTVLLLVGLLLVRVSFAQTEATQYFMSSLPQVSNANPAFVPKYKFSIGLPGISSTAIAYSNNGFSYNDLITTSNGETLASLEKWNRSLANKNYITTAAQSDLSRVGFTVSPKLYFQLSVIAKSYSRIMVPKEISALAVKGNSAIAGNYAFSPRVETTSWVEYAVAAAYKLNDKLTLGARIKYLQGMVNATTINSAMTVSVGDNYSMTAAADVSIKTSGVYDATSSGYAFDKQFRNYTSNKGAALDVGATYNLNDKLSFAASIVDAGGILWKNNLYEYSLSKATANYTFSGFDADKLVQANPDYIDAQADSINNRFKFRRNATGSYRTWLPGKMYVSGNYLLAKNLHAGLLLFTEKYQGRISQGVSASVSKNFGKSISTTLSYTVSNRSYNNFGAGVSFNLSPIQLYVVGDNLLNAPVSLLSHSNLNSYINNTQVFSLRAGLNIVWGWSNGNNKSGKVSAGTTKKKKSGGTLMKVRQRSRQ